MTETGEFKTGALPPQVLLGRLVQERTLAFGTELATLVKNEKGLYLNPNFVGFAEKTPRFPVHIEKADEISPETFRYDSNEGWAIVGIYLFNDKSPYVRDEDVLEFGDNKEIYEIVCLPELSPFLTHQNRIAVNEGSQISRIRNYLTEVREGTQLPPHYLNENETLELISVVQDPLLAAYLDEDFALLCGEDPDFMTIK